MMTKRVISRRFERSKKNYQQSYGRLFPHGSQWGKVFLGRTASRDWRGSDCNTAVWPLRLFDFNGWSCSVFVLGCVFMCSSNGGTSLTFRESQFWFWRNHSATAPCATRTLQGGAQRHSCSRAEVTAQTAAGGEVVSGGETMQSGEQLQTPESRHRHRRSSR